MNILEQIIEAKRREVEQRKVAVPVKVLERVPYFDRKPLSLSTSVRNKEKTGIIAEFKRKSPSKGVINAGAEVAATTQAYAAAGASGLSVLTDEAFFGGSNEDLTVAFRHNVCPILRKDFTVDEYQIVEARSIGADAVLLIAAVLDPRTSRKLTAFAHELGLEVLLEVHNEEELLANLDVGADLIGVNNRDLKTFEVSIETSKQLSSQIPDGVVKVSESGISSPDTIVELRQYGFEGFLIGENFMKEKDPGAAAAAFTQKLKALTAQQQ